MMRDPDFHGLRDAIRAEFDTDNVLLAAIHEAMVNEAVWLSVVHDANPRAVSARVQGVMQAQNRFIDFPPVSMR